MKTKLEVLFTPADFEALKARDLKDTVCVVFDVLRATTTMITALANGAVAVVPAVEISEALELHKRYPDALLAGERNGLRIRADLTGGVDFDLGNSPREFTKERVSGRTIIMTTTNGTRALRSAAHAYRVIVGSFVNLAAVAVHVRQCGRENLLVICSGTLEQASIEDAFAAGALCDLVWDRYVPREIADSAQIARELYLAHKTDLLGAMKLSRNGRRLLGISDLAADVEFCLRMDTVSKPALLYHDGTVRFAAC